MDSYKAPRSNGFQLIFFKSFWDVVGDDVWHVVSDAFGSGLFDLAIVETLVMLIPKINPPTRLEELRPISLYNVILKFITKVIVGRVHPFLDDIVGPLQSNFIPGRSSSDNVIIAQEVLHNMCRKKGKSSSLVFKIDFEKTYDPVNCEFLCQTLFDFNFPNALITLIMNCVTSCNLSMVWNSEKMPSFAPTRGSPSKGSLSPYLFVLYMEKLALLIAEKVN